MLVLLTVLVLAMPNSVPAGTVEAEGEAAINGNDLVSARRSAEADGLRRCVEKAIGFTIKSDVTSEQSETTKNDKTQFSSAVRDKVMQNSEGYVTSHEVFDEKRDGNTLKVTVRAHIVESKLKADLETFRALLVKAGNPRVAVLVTEKHAGKLQKESMLGGAIEKGLASRGFIVLGPDVTKRILAARKTSGTRCTSVNCSPSVGQENVIDAARDAGADIIIDGEVIVDDLGVMKDAEFAALAGQHKVDINAVIRGVQIASGEVTSATPIKMTSIGIDVDRAVQRAFVAKGNNLVDKTLDELVPGLKNALERTANAGQRFVVQVRNIKSFRTQAGPLVQGIQAASGVTNATQRSFDKGLLIVDVACTCTASDLQLRIFELAKGELGSLDLKKVNGSQIELSL
ncbi:MAG: flagellar assembly protein T N-terminal domain-containing protein [Clostridia bacterium]|nr:flagellar assembly protein T N-terminal domain-containing protein [Deltaproteobacteria bacterium]